MDVSKAGADAARGKLSRLMEKFVNESAKYLVFPSDPDSDDYDDNT